MGMECVHFTQTQGGGHASLGLAAQWAAPALPAAGRQASLGTSKKHFSAGFVLLRRKSACVVSWLLKRLAFYCSSALV